MIKSKIELQEYINSDNTWFDNSSAKSKLIAKIAQYPAYHLNKYLKYLRKQEYYINTAKNKLHGLLAIFYERRKNKLGLKLGIEIPPNCFGKGLQIYHCNIVINCNVKAGDNCKLHGCNCIGNNGKSQEAPQLGDNVDIGFGAVVIGDINIPNGTTIGANALVNKSFETENTLLVGIPAKSICKN